MRFFKFFLLAVLFVFGVLFFVQNKDVLGTDMPLVLNTYLGYTWQPAPIPFFFVVVLAFFVGAVACLLCLISDRLRNSMQLRDCRKRIRALEAEVKALRQIPLVEAQETVEASSAKDKNSALPA